MLKVSTLSFKSDTNNTNSLFNNKKNNTAPIPVNYGADTLDLVSVEKDLRKKEKQQEKLQKMSAYGTVAIGAGLVGSLVLSIITMVKRKGKTHAEEEMKKLTEVTLDWFDFNGKKDIVAPLNAKTTSKALKETFNKILDGSKLSEKANKWGGSDGNNLDMIYLYGHGGTGKTYVAEQFAQEIGAIFTSIKYPDMGSPFKDAASMRISNTFKDIETMANKNKERPVVVCIDEFDAVIKKVNEARSSDEANKSRAAVLTGMDALRRKCKNVTFITTSNYHPKNGQVDEIALRRFNNKIEVPLPDKEQIEGLLEMYLKDIEAIKGTDFIKQSSSQKFINKMEKEGYSNGEIQLIAEEAGKIFRSTLKDVKDEDLVKHPFKIEYLEKAMRMIGQAASKTNTLMNVSEFNAEELLLSSLKKKRPFWKRIFNINN